MSVSRRDSGSVSGPSGPSGLSLGMLCLGLASLAVASLVCVFFYIQLRKGKKLRLRLAAEEKLAKIGQPVLQRGPQHIIDSALDMSRMTREMKEQYAQKQFRPLQSSQAYQDSGTQFKLPQSSSGSGYSSSKSSGPIPTSSSEETTASKAKSREQASSTFHSLPNSHANIPVQTPKMALVEATRPSFAREKRISRVAVPSALLRGLGDLPQLPAPGWGVANSVSHLSPRPDSASEGEDSYTPVLGLDLELNAKPATSNNLEDDLEFEIERSRWLTSTLTNAFECTTPKKSTFDLEAQHPRPSEKRMTGGPSRVTVDYFSLTTKRNLAPPLAETNKGFNKAASCHRTKASNGSCGGDVSPHKRPDFVLPPIPSSAKKNKSTTSQDPSAFRPLSLGLSLNSTSKSSSFNATTMFGDVPHTFWTDAAELSMSRSSSKESTGEGANSSKDTVQFSSSSNDSLREDNNFESATSLEDLADEAYGGASVHSKDEEVEENPVEVEREEVNINEVEPTPSISTNAYLDNSPQVPFMTIHHRAVFPDKLGDKEDYQRDSRQLTPDLSIIHDAPLPPTALPSGTATKSGFASSLRAKAKLTLSRSKTVASPNPTPSIVLNRQAIGSSKKTSPTKHLVRPVSLVSSSKSPADSLNSFGPPLETWKVCTGDQTHSPSFLTAAPALGLGLSDEHGVAMDHQLSSSIGHGESSHAHSPILAESTWERKEIKAYSGDKPESYKPSRYSALERKRGTTRNSDKYRISYHDEMLGTPPMGRMASPQFGTLSTLSPKLGQTATMIGSDWTLNRRQHHAHQASIASSYCDTISTCLTGGSENVGTYNGDETAQDQRTRLLQTIQKNKNAKGPQHLRNSGIDDQRQKGFYSHSARVSVISAQSTIRATSPITAPSQTSTFVNTLASSPSTSKKPTHLTIQVHKGSSQLEAVGPLTAPLTPPLTPNDQSATMSSTTKSLLAEAALLQDKTPSLEQQKASRLAKLRPLSLAVQQQQTQNSICSPTARFMATTSSLHKSQSSTQSSSSNNSNTTSTTTPSASSSNTSLYQAHVSPSRLSFYTSSSPGRANFASSKRLSRSGVAPVGVLPTLSAEASPSFLTSTSTPRTVGNGAVTSSPRSAAMVTWDLTSSPRFSRASINIGSIPYHSPLSLDTFSSPIMVRRR